MQSYKVLFADQDKAIKLLQGEFDRVYTELGALQEQADANQPVKEWVLDQVAESIVKVTVLTLVGGLVGGPILAYATHSLLGPKVVEAALGGFIAGVSTELAERAGAKAPELVARRDNPAAELAELAKQHELESDDVSNDSDSHADSRVRDDDADGR